MSKIEWTDVTWNPTRGCSRVSPGCEHCYAERMAHRLNHPGGAYEGLTRLTARGPVWTGDVRLVNDQLEAPLRWRKPRMVFVDSMSDLFHEWVPFEFIDQVFAAMALCPQHTFQVLTKRPERMREYLSPLRVERVERQEETIAPELRCWPEWPLPNVYLGVTAENQDAADARIPLLLDTPAAVRFVSAEPLLGALVLERLGRHWLGPPSQSAGMNYGLDWVIVGGESGPGARPMDGAWVRSIRDQCTAEVVPFFFKQWGGVHKKQTGRTLDGRTWDEMPLERKVG